MPPPVARGSVTSKEGPVSDDIHQALYDRALANRTVVAPRRSIEGRIQRTLADPSPHSSKGQWMTHRLKNAQYIQLLPNFSLESMA